MDVSRMSYRKVEDEVASGIRGQRSVGYKQGLASSDRGATSGAAIGVSTGINVMGVTSGVCTIKWFPSSNV